MGISYHRPFCLGRHSCIGSSPACGSAKLGDVGRWTRQDSERSTREREREMMADLKSTKRIRGAGLLENSVGQRRFGFPLCEICAVIGGTTTRLHLLLFACGQHLDVTPPTGVGVPANGDARGRRSAGEGCTACEEAIDPWRAMDRRDFLVLRLSDQRYTRPSKSPNLVRGMTQRTIMLIGL
ncbi:hypothetical protein GW17_00011127 [Ensete ventricosum]|nr:hypothetical protein GW17_00011127 [Ensete ventricosum]